MGLRDLTASLRGFAFARPHLLLVAAPGATGIRIGVEHFARRSGWPMAESPADADVLVEAGRPARGLADAAELVERQLGEPYLLVAISDAADVEPRLGEVPGRLAGSVPTRRPRTDVPEPPMAERADDRDGLALDVLRIPFGPILPHWPAGLRLSLDVQGDVVQSCAVELLGDVDGGSFWAAPGRQGARCLDRVARLLAVAGWAAMGQRCQGLRDRALAGRDVERGVADVAQRIRRSRLLRALLGGVGETPETGDAWQRLSDWLTGGTGSDRDAAARLSSGEWLDRLPGLVSGQELTTVRLIVASVDIDVAEFADHHAGAAYG